MVFAGDVKEGRSVCRSSCSFYVDFSLECFLRFDGCCMNDDVVVDYLKEYVQMGTRVFGGGG